MSAPFDRRDLQDQIARAEADDIAAANRLLALIVTSLGRVALQMLLGVIAALGVFSLCLQIAKWIAL